MRAQRVERRGVWDLEKVGFRVLHFYFFFN